MEYQLRNYTVRSGEIEEWVEEWRTRVYPLRLKKGFKVLGAWTIMSENRFVWIIGWDGPGTFEKANKEYYDSAERKAIKPDPSRHLAATETHMLATVI